MPKFRSIIIKGEDMLIGVLGRVWGIVKKFHGALGVYCEGCCRWGTMAFKNDTTTTKRWKRQEAWDSMLVVDG